MKIYYKNWRLFLIFLFLFLSIAAIVSRMVYVQVEQGNFLLQKGNNQNTSLRVIKFKRGSIYDKNGIPLAISITGFDLFALSGLREDDFLKIKNTLKLNDLEYKSFNKKSLIKNSLSFEEMRKVRSLRIDRLELEKTYKRHYPLGEQVAPLVGFSGRDGYGLEGLEKSYNSILTGRPLKERVLRDGARSTIQRLEVLEFGENSKDIYLTIDSNIQYIAYKYLVEAIKNNDGTGGTVIILDNSAKEVLALASYPSYNPNNPMRSIKKIELFLKAMSLDQSLNH